MRNSTWAVFLGLMVSCWAGAASAQLSEVDLVAGSGDGKVTLDAATGLYWLDLPETTNVSVTDVLGGAGGWVGAGWRYATQSEICDLFAAYALAVTTCGGSNPASASGDLLATLQGFLGLTTDNGINRGTTGLYDDGGDPARVGVARLTYTISTDTSVSLVQSSATFDNAIANVGSWLVRDTPPPPPVPAFSFRITPMSATAVALVLAASAGLTGALRRPRSE